MAFLKSTAVAEQLGTQYWTLFALIRSRKIPAPGKDSSGDFVWLPEDVERARLALAARRAKSKRGAQGVVVA